MLKSVPTSTRARDFSGEHVHSCCVHDVTIVELFPSRIMTRHYPDDSSVFFDVVFSMLMSFTEVHLDCDDHLFHRS